MSTTYPDDITAFDADQREALGRVLGRWSPEPHQIPPPGDWLLWLLLAGRGSGKTDAGAAYMNAHEQGPACDARIPGGHRMRIVGPTLGDAAEAVTGVAGLMAHNPRIRLIHDGLTWRAVWPSGASARLFGTATGGDGRQTGDVDRLRAGGNSCLDWYEELAAWPKLDVGWMNAQMGLRVGTDPRAIATTTPRSRPLIRRLVGMRGIAATRASTADNPYLPRVRRDALYAMFAGTPEGEQELEGRLRATIEGAFYGHLDQATYLRPLAFDPARELHAAMDFGFVAPTRLLLCQRSVWDDVHVLAEWSWNYRTAIEIATELRDGRHDPARPELSILRYVRKLYGDPADPGAIRTIGETLAWQPIGGTGAGSRLDRLRLVGQWLLPHPFEQPPQRRAPKMFVDPARCPLLAWELAEGVRYPDNRNPETRTPDEEPLKVDDHSVEALGRFMVTQFGPIAPEAGSRTWRANVRGARGGNGADAGAGNGHRFRFPGRRP